MLFAQESTAETHRFNHSRKKPPRSKTKSTHRQGPLFADMLHVTTPAQRIYAHAVCGSTTVFNKKGGVRLYCNRRDCPVCFKRRYKKMARRIYTYYKDTGNKLYWWRINSPTHTKILKFIKKAGGEYVCMPIVNKHGVEQEMLICTIPAPVPGGQRLSTNLADLEANFSVWTKTPANRRISFSSGFKIKDRRPVEKNANYYAGISLKKVIPYAESVGGIIEQRSKSYVKWHDVDPEELTTKLNEDDIVAYQITMDKTLFEEARNAEDAMAQTASNSTPDYDAIPLDRYGKAIAPPVKLRHLLRNSIAIGLPFTPPVDPLLNEAGIKATSPPPS